MIGRGRGSAQNVRNSAARPGAGKCEEKCGPPRGGPAQRTKNTRKKRVTATVTRTTVAARRDDGGRDDGDRGDGGLLVAATVVAIQSLIRPGII